MDPREPLGRILPQRLGMEVENLREVPSILAHELHPLSISQDGLAHIQWQLPWNFSLQSSSLNASC